MFRVFIWTVLFIANLLLLMAAPTAWSGFWFGLSVFGLLDAVTREMDERRFLYKELGWDQ